MEAERVEIIKFEMTSQLTLSHTNLQSKKRHVAKMQRCKNAHTKNASVQNAPTKTNPSKTHLQKTYPSKIADYISIYDLIKNYISSLF